MSFILRRYLEIHDELIHRGFDVQDYSDNWKGIDPKYFNNHDSDDKEKEILVERITYRILNSNKKCWYYYGKVISKEDAINLLKK